MEGNFYTSLACSLCCWKSSYPHSKLAVRYLFNFTSLNYLMNISDTVTSQLSELLGVPGDPDGQKGWRDIIAPRSDKYGHRV
jgi:hypothetical protein